jgi:hypothetical protein
MRHFSGDFDGLRLLMEDELDFIAGGEGEDGDELSTLPEIVVIAKPDRTEWFMPNHLSWGGGPDINSPDGPEPTDASAVRMDVMFTRQLTALEQQAVNALAYAIHNTTAAVDAIPNTSIIKLADGKTVTGAELKEIWKNTDFVINENGFKYANGTDRGEADYNGGNPVVSFNIATLAAYSQLEGGMTYLPLHELGHMTAAGRAQNESYLAGRSTYEQNERLANDIARAIADNSGDKILGEPGGGGYSPTPPIIMTPLYP